MKKILHPTQVLIAIFIVTIIWLAPIANKPKQIIKTDSPILIEYNNNNLMLAIPEAGASCAPSCRIRVCVDWDPTPCGSNPWDIGCCLAYADECDPDCDTGGGGGNQPPTISHALTCSQLGSNDWCTGTLILDLTASDPQNAQIVISGDINGISFACPTGNAICSIPLSDGEGTINYKVDSSTGLFATGSTTYKKDSTTPEIEASINASSGFSGWYITSAVISASSVDSLSGISSFEMNVNNAGWVIYDETTFTDGIHTIQYRATDNAGNVTETTSQEIKVDTITPTINVSITGSIGLNNWYISDVVMNATSTDVTSGISIFEMNIDNSGWATYTSATFTDGIHTIQYRATDHAGNTYTSTLQEVKVDTTTPSLSLNTNGTQGMNGWYVSNTSITPTVTDLTSGIYSVEFSLNNGIFSTYNTSLQFTEGVHNYQIKATDNAGNITTTPFLTLKVDTVAPTVNKDTNIKLGDELFYKLFDATSGLWIQRVVIEDEDEHYKKHVWLDTISGNQVQNSILWDGKFADGETAEAGEYYIVFKISDQAGNETFHTTEVAVNALSFLQYIPPFTPPTTNIEVSSNELLSEEEQSFGNQNNGSTATETTSTTAGGEVVFQGLTAQAGVMSSSSLFNFGNENTTAPLTNSNILWGAVASAALGMTLAEWQRQKQEEEKQRAEQPRGTSKGARAKYEAMMKQKRIVGESEALRDAKAHQKKEEAIEEQWRKGQREKTAQTMSQVIATHAAIREQEEERAKTGGGKPLLKPVLQDENPPKDGIFDKVKQWWNNLWNKPSEQVTEPIQTPTIIPTATFIPTIAISPTVTSTPEPSKIYAINGPITADQIPEEFRCTLREKLIIDGRELYSDYYKRCKIGEQLIEGILTDLNGWWWNNGETPHWQTGNLTKWEAIKSNQDVWALALALGLDGEGTDLRLNVPVFGEYLGKALYNRFWYFDQSQISTYGEGVLDPSGQPLGTNGRLTVLGSLESLQIRVTEEGNGFVPRGLPASQVIQPPYDDSITNGWESAWHVASDILKTEPQIGFIKPTDPFDFGNPTPDMNPEIQKTLNKGNIGEGHDQILYTYEGKAYVLTFEQKIYFNAFGK